MNLGLEHSYATLPPQCFVDVAPVAVANPQLLVFNSALASFLGFDTSLIDYAAVLLSGNELPGDARPIAMAYAGHQFGHFVPQLGDGRAILLGERRGADGQLHDVQLKGSGRTPFSRSGDGRAAVGPMLREYLISEAMHALGIPTTRSLAVVATGERVLREEPAPGAVLTRVAASHLRVGTFEYFAARADHDALRALLAYCIARHAPELATAPVPALAVLKWVADRQAALIARWLGVGFIHGVMNTDNMALSGQTIDYGPCAFMDHYDPQTVFSSIDHRGRYAYSNQPVIAQWNLARFAETLLPLIDADQAVAIQGATAIISRFPAEFEARYQQLLRAKFGFTAVRETDAALCSRFLTLLHLARADFTLAFHHLTQAALGAPHEGALRAQLGNANGLDNWLQEWRTRQQLEARSPAERHAAMRRENPTFIARNHLVEVALRAASDRGDLTPFENLLAVIRHPFQDHPGREAWMQPPRDDERVLATFCGT
ncbi:MAG: protein adenylyltransferase SelO [Steroidobacteraceae bacterium]